MLQSSRKNNKAARESASRRSRSVTRARRRLSIQSLELRFCLASDLSVAFAVADIGSPDSAPHSAMESSPIGTASAQQQSTSAATQQQSDCAVASDSEVAQLEFTHVVAQPADNSLQSTVSETTVAAPSCGSEVDTGSQATQDPNKSLHSPADELSPRDDTFADNDAADGLAGDTTEVEPRQTDELNTPLPPTGQTVRAVTSAEQLNESSTNQQNARPKAIDIRSDHTTSRTYGFSKANQTLNSTANTKTPARNFDRALKEMFSSAAESDQFESKIKRQAILPRGARLQQAVFVLRRESGTTASIVANAENAQSNLPTAQTVSAAEGMDSRNLGGDPAASERSSRDSALTHGNPSPEETKLQAAESNPASPPSMLATFRNSLPFGLIVTIGITVAKSNALLQRKPKKQLAVLSFEQRSDS